MTVIRQIERNEKPCLTTLKIVSPPLAVIFALASAGVFNEMHLLRVGETLFLGGLILAAWAHQANERWTLPKYLLRYAASCGVVVAWLLACGR